MHTRNTDMKFPDYWGNGNQRTKYQLKRGQSIFSSAYFSKNTKIPINWVRASLNELTSQLTIQLTRKPFGYIVTMLNYDEAMSFATHSTTPFATHSQVTNDSLATHPATQSQLTSSTNNKSVKTGKIVKTEKTVKNEKIEQEQTPPSSIPKTENTPIEKNTNRFGHISGTLLEDSDFEWMIKKTASRGKLGDAVNIYTGCLNELLGDDEFVTIWEEFIVYRKKEQKKKTALTRRSERQLLSDILGDYMGPLRVNFILEYIMGKGWMSYKKEYFDGVNVPFPKLDPADDSLTAEDLKKLEKYQ